MAALQYVVFSLNEQSYGIEISKVREVLSYRKVTPLPHVTRFVKGVINLRGTILPVFDLGDQFDLPNREYTRYHVIIVMEIAGRIMGVIVDEISDVVEIMSGEFQNTSNLPPGIQQEFLKGVGKKGDEMIILLDIDRLLSIEELGIADAVA